MKAKAAVGPANCRTSSTVEVAGTKNFGKTPEGCTSPVIETRLPQLQGVQCLKTQIVQSCASVGGNFD